jgi:putative nucleotidyltransferase with HDIG domain
MVEVEKRVERVLVVDDEEPVARTIARWLEKSGFECRIAHSMQQALEEAAGFGIVLTDVHMPGGSGLDLARALKKRDSATQVIVITGSTTLETAIEAIRLDTDDYLLKPFESQDLIHAVRRAAEHRRLLIENQEYRQTLEDRVKEQARRLEKLYLSSIRSLIGALEAKDIHTCGHSARVSDYAVSLLQCVGGVDEESLRVGAQLHDIGKIGVTGGILGKAGPLDGDEVLHIRQHPSIGVKILSPLLEDRTALDIVRHHHERWDGRGYPDGLAGEEIPLAARIVAVADTFDAMTTSRAYREARTAEQAVREIQKEAGRQFDPDVAAHAANVFLRPVRRVS